MKINKKLLFIPIFFICVLTVNYIAHYYFAKKEFNQKINFLISKIEISSALRCSFYNKNGAELSLNSYTFFAHQNIKVNDSITKNKNSSKLIIFRKNRNMKYEIFLELKPD